MLAQVVDHGRPALANLVSELSSANEHVLGPEGRWKVLISIYGLIRWQCFPARWRFRQRGDFFALETDRQSLPAPIMKSSERVHLASGARLLPSAHNWSRVRATQHSKDRVRGGYARQSQTRNRQRQVIS